MTATILRGDALALPLDDATVDLVVTSPPYFGLRSYQDGCADCDSTGKAKRPDSHGMKVCPACGLVANRKRCRRCGESMKWPAKADLHTDDACATCGGTGTAHYSGQLGSEATPAEFVDALIAATAEMVRVLKPSGSIWVNLGDKYASGGRGTYDLDPGRREVAASRPQDGARPKSLLGIPWRYALRCIDDLGLILRAEVIWSKPNGLPESVTDRVRRSHEQWFHFTREPRYFSAVDEVRETYADVSVRRMAAGFAGNTGYTSMAGRSSGSGVDGSGSGGAVDPNPLGKLPGSVWVIPTQPLTVPAYLGVDHFAAYPMELPRRIIRGWSPAGVCVACGHGRRPVTYTPKAAEHVQQAEHTGQSAARGGLGATSQLKLSGGPLQRWREQNPTVHLGYACGCPDTTAPTRPSVVLDPFSGTGTTALVAHALGRHGIGIDMSGDYSRLARWRTTDPGQLASALEVEKPEPARQTESLFDLWDGAAS